ncbi:MAG: LysM peptidoglycan-binding domain-containing protein [Betaproteobacteria bacterium]|nr:LysM peptidoglycan-binding domain-containing protein [Betaproteobacteria bacterium]
MTRKDLRALVAALLIGGGGLPLAANGAGLGQLTVQSALGQPLKAQIDILADSGADAPLSATLASPQAYQRADTPWSPALMGVKVRIKKRADGTPYLSITSRHAITDPFLYVMIRLNRPGGVLTRRYALLIDPPGFTEPATAPRILSAHLPAVRRPAHAVGEPAHRAGWPKTYTVRSGDTLTTIAARLRPPGISVDQMIVGLRHANPGRFAREGINWLEAGRTLRVPDLETLRSTTAAAATAAVQRWLWTGRHPAVANMVAHPAPENSPGAAKTAGASADILMLSQAESPKPDPTAVMQEEIRNLQGEVAAEQALVAQASARIAALNASIGVIEGRRAPPIAPAPVTRPQHKPRVTSGANTVPGALPAMRRAPVRAPAVNRPPPPVSGVSEAKPVHWGGRYWGLLAAFVALFGLVAVVFRRRRRLQEPAFFTEPAVPRGPASVSTTPASASQGEQRLSPIEAAARLTDLDLSEWTQTNIHAQDVDPVAEAEVYLAYGRHAQAEEVLKDALAKSPGREDVVLKLLELYAEQKNVSAFEALATQWGARREDRSGAAWDSVARMGRELDPLNPLYGAAEGGDAGARDLGLERGQAADAAVSPATFQPETLPPGDDRLHQTPSHDAQDVPAALAAAPLQDFVPGTGMDTLHFEPLGDAQAASALLDELPPDVGRWAPGAQKQVLELVPERDGVESEPDLIEWVDLAESRPANRDKADLGADDAKPSESLRPEE